jgi:hypothetical protein
MFARQGCLISVNLGVERMRGHINACNIMEIEPSYGIKFFDDVSSDRKELLRNPAEVYVPSLQLRVTGRGSKASLHHSRYKPFLIPFLWLGVARVEEDK